MNVVAPGPAAAARMSERRVGVIGALLAAVGPISLALFTPAMPELVRIYDTTEAAVKLTLSLYFAGFALAQLVCGPLSDGFGRKPVTIGFMGIFFAASVLAMFAPTIEVLIVARLLQGIGAAVGIAIARAVVRDLFNDERAVRITNLIGIILALGPAISPTLGGIAIELAGWHSVFVLMALMSVVVVFVTILCLRETVTRDLSRIRPAALIRAYATLLGNGYFMLSSLVIAGTMGAIYAQATVLPFILMDRVGLTPAQFGVGMLMQSGLFFAGSLVARWTLRILAPARLVPIGLAFVAAGSLAMAVFLRVWEPTFLIVMAPVSLYAFGIAFVMPAMSVAAMAPFPRIAGSASSMTGFLQMGTGLVGGLVAALIGEPVTALAIVVPALGLIAIASWAIWRLLPEPPPMTATPPRHGGPVS
ncbi:multidrug effflux MFS transporter [Nitratireductor alexandrii]|uniref:multidrug effflux MFS transporter n=1 Tax=Nitratireductor alexandrii TaxID=2448161 RepID=UPI000FD80406|nr:multidrug effflux MFS transporter [Nitratireductor alexandrii]